MNFCVKCGKRLQPFEKFCTNCGNPLTGNAPVEPSGSALNTDSALHRFDPMTYLNNAVSRAIKFPKAILGIFLILALVLLFLLIQSRNMVPDCNDPDVLTTVQDLSLELIKKEYVRNELADLRKQQMEANNFLNMLGGDFGSAARAGRLLSGGYSTLTESDLPAYEINFSGISLITEESVSKETPKRVCRAKISSTVATKNDSSQVETYVEYDIQPDKSSDGGNVISVRIQ